MLDFGVRKRVLLLIVFFISGFGTFSKSSFLEFPKGFPKQLFNDVSLLTDISFMLFLTVYRTFSVSRTEDRFLMSLELFFPREGSSIFAIFLSSSRSFYFSVNFYMILLTVGSLFSILFFGFLEKAI